MQGTTKPGSSYVSAPELWHGLDVPGPSPNPKLGHNLDVPRPAAEVEVAPLPKEHVPPRVIDHILRGLYVHVGRDQDIGVLAQRYMVDGGVYSISVRETGAVPCIDPLARSGRALKRGRILLWPR